MQSTLDKQRKTVTQDKQVKICGLKKCVMLRICHICQLFILLLKFHWKYSLTINGVYKVGDLAIDTDTENDGKDIGIVKSGQQQSLNARRGTWKFRDAHPIRLSAGDWSKLGDTWQMQCPQGQAVNGIVSHFRNNANGKP